MNKIKCVCVCVCVPGSLGRNAMATDFQLVTWKLGFVEPVTSCYLWTANNFTGDCYKCVHRL